VVVVCIKYDRFPMELLQVFIPGKVDEYKDVVLLMVGTAIILRLRLTEGTHRMKKR
jgi:VanZ family protein